jgi:ABC-type phosphate/phosphonate transport system permease subunit
MPPWVTWPARLIVVMARSFHPVIVAIVFVKAVGFGALAGTLALTVASIGFIGKLFTEAIEEISLKQVEAIRATGAPFASILAYGVLPQVFSRFIGFATYQLDSNLRNSTMVGIVGAGGIGGTLFAAFQRFDYDFVCAILIAIITLIMIGEVLATRCARSSSRTQPSPTFSAAAARCVASGTPKTTDGDRRTRGRERTDLAAIHPGPEAVALPRLPRHRRGDRRVDPDDRSHSRIPGGCAEQVADLLARMWPVDFAHYRVGVHDALMETIHIATLGTLLSMVLALPVGVLAARNLVPFAAINLAAKLVLVSSRSVNSLVWALLFVAIFGPGALAGTLAIAFRSIGFVGKLFGEALEEAQPGPIEALTAAGRTLGIADDVRLLAAGQACVLVDRALSLGYQRSRVRRARAGRRRRHRHDTRLRAQPASSGTASR